MQYDLGLSGLGILVALALGFGVIAHVLAGRHTTWMWAVGALAAFLGGLYFSEVLFATATEDEIQPIIDGLALDESMLGGLLVGSVAVLVTWFLTQRRTHGPIAH